MPECVLKIGGSLGQEVILPELCHALSEQARRHRLLIVPGGGSFANVVRDSYNKFPIGDSAAHWMAILGMEQYGLLLADLIPDARTVRTLAEAKTWGQAGEVHVFLPYALMRQCDPLPHTWDVTSDSIGAWIAAQTGAALYVLVKDQDGLYATGPEAPEERPLHEMSLAQLSACRGVDPHLHRMLSKDGPHCWVINGKHPERLAELLDSGAAQGTCINTETA